MTDPWEALRAPAPPVEPDPRFAAALRIRLQRALLDKTGDAMTSTTGTSATGTSATGTGTTGTSTTGTSTTGTSTTGTSEVPQRTLTPYLAVDDARRALDWYTQAFGAVPRGAPIVMDDGRIGHAELAVGDSVLMLADEAPALGLLGPTARGGASQSLVLQVPDVDSTVQRAVRLGAELTRPVADSPYGRNGVLNDPFGHRWMVFGLPAPAPRGQGHVGYASLWTPDADRAATFYGGVLGWRFVPGSTPQGRQVADVRPPLGIWGGQQRGTTFLCFTVDDVRAAMRRVRAAGGTADEPSERPYGLVADCADDQGMAFAVCELPPGEPAPTAPGRPGELAYLTLEVVDSARARAFFGAALGWRFTPGRAADGWGVEDIRPMTGMHGGHERATVLPMYAVADIETAVARVRALGGHCTDPQRMPYGITADCVDDQGTRFYLGQL